ncbi:MAG: metal-dependent hydrolase [Bacteroidia bacterium]|nr:metal-dependent hydrolase [Bacteroidia bacterium]
MQITYYGHSAFGIETGGKHLLFDPFISPNEKAAHIRVDEIPADYILVSHAHGDHIADVERIARRTGAMVVGTFEVVTWFNQHGIERYHPMNHGGSWKFDFGTVRLVSAVHSSSFPDGSYGGNPCGFVVQTPEGSFYYSGDTALTYDMKLIGERWKPDFAFLCMGDNFTMGPEDALTAAGWAGCDTVIGMHFDTFGYIVIDHDAAQAAFAAAGKTLHLMPVGGTLTL